MKLQGLFKNYEGFIYLSRKKEQEARDRRKCGFGKSYLPRLVWLTLLSEVTTAISLFNPVVGWFPSAAFLLLSLKLYALLALHHIGF